MNDLRFSARPEGFARSIILEYGSVCGVEEFGGISVHIEGEPGGVITRAQAAALHAFLSACLERFDTTPEVSKYAGSSGWRMEAKWLARKLADKPEKYVEILTHAEERPPHPPVVELPNDTERAKDYYNK
jgi:hypothetical protein